METTEPGSGRPQSDTHQPQDFRSILVELRGLVRAFADTPPDHMTPHFYAHAFNEYDIAIRALLDALPDGYTKDLDR